MFICSNFNVFWFRKVKRKRVYSLFIVVLCFSCPLVLLPVLSQLPNSFHFLPATMTQTQSEGQNKKVAPDEKTNGGTSKVATEAVEDLLGFSRV